MSVEYRIATEAEFATLWDRNIAENPEETMWPIWRERFRSRIALGQAVTFAVVIDGDPVGEGTLEMDTGKDPRLCDGKSTAYLSALRINREFEGQGHISKLMQIMECYAKEQGYTRLTIGVEAAEARNLAIYLHWGFDQFVMSEMDGNALVLYYTKNI